LAAPEIREAVGAFELSSRTVQRRLNEAGLNGRVAAHKPYVSKKNKAVRVRFAKEHINWSIEKWRKVLWTDESKFNLHNSDGIRYVRRPVNHRFDPKYTVATVKHGGGNIMVWGGFSYDGIGPLHRVSGILDQHQYKDIMERVMLPHARTKMPDGWVMQQDNDPKHKAKSVMQWFGDNGVKLMDWPAQSPDLNPIENLWWEVERKLQGRKFAKPDELYAAVQREWAALPTTLLQKLIDSMPRRCKAVIEAKGGPTKY
jgi:hypothetical protein